MCANVLGPLWRHGNGQLGPVLMERYSERTRRKGILAEAVVSQRRMTISAALSDPVCRIYFDKRVSIVFETFV